MSSENDGRDRKNGEVVPAKQEEANRGSVDRLKSPNPTESKTEAGSGKSAEGSDRPEKERFSVMHDEYGRVVRIEGLLEYRSGPPSNSDKELQEKFRNDHVLEKGQDAYHLIAPEHGGPLASDDKAVAASNFVAADERAISRHREFEKQVTADLKAGRAIYCRVDVTYASTDGASRLAARADYLFFERDASGSLKPYTVPGYMVRLDVRSDKAASESLSEHDVKQFYENDYRPDRTGITRRFQ